MAHQHHIAQFNIARMRAPLDAPLMSGFVSQLEEVNTLAEATPGFVWRLQTEEGDATSIRPYEDDRILINMSVWESIESLFDFVYKGAHAGPFRERGQWFEPQAEPTLVLWWVPAGELPTVEEGKERLERLRREGPSAEAFTFKQTFPVPERSVLPA